MAITYEADSAALAGSLARLNAIGYHEAGVAARLGLDDLDRMQMRALPIYRAERLAERDAQATAIDLFMLQGRVPVPELGALFGREDQDALVRAGILVRDGDGFRAQASLYPVGPRLVFSDHAWPQLDREGFSTVPHDQVMYVGTDSRWLARVTRRPPVAEALDLCCGSGIHALLAAAHAGRATAVDINPKAVRCTRFNARAWGLANLEALEGDLYGPLGERRFGLITANPPFVPAPAQEVGFRDGGPSGEDVQARIVAGLPRHLAPGGSAQIVTEFGEGDGESIEQRLRRWLGGAPMAIHILRLRVIPAQAYAIGHADGDSHADFLASVGGWAQNLRAQGYRQVVSVLLAFEWSEDPWTRVDEAQAPAREAAAELEACFQAERLARDPALPDRLRAGGVARVGPIALLEGRALGAQVADTAQARLAGQAMPMEHPLAPMERDLLCCLDQPAATRDLLTAADRAGLPQAAVLEALTALVRKGLVRPQP